MEDITNVKMYMASMQQYHIDSKLLSLSQLTKPLLPEAQYILAEIKALLDEIAEEKKKDRSERDVDLLIKLKEKIAEKSSRFYELIPDSRYTDQPVPPIDDNRRLSEKSNMVSRLLDFEISTKIILGALYNTFKINPLDYCFHALDVRLLRLSKTDAEYKLIRKYVNASEKYHYEFILNVFAIERKGEAERISKWRDLHNRMLLWHGSKISNFMGILANGLRIAPPEASSSGINFGKGIYFSDVFTKSFRYTGDNVGGETPDYRLLLLCEVVLGDMQELEKPQFVEELQLPYKSVLGMGRYVPKPNEKVVFPNGCTVPVGRVVDLKEEKKEKFREKKFAMDNNEYVVYDNSQVRIRYVVQVKNQN